MMFFQQGVVHTVCQLANTTDQGAEQLITTGSCAANFGSGTNHTANPVEQVNEGDSVTVSSSGGIIPDPLGTTGATTVISCSDTSASVPGTCYTLPVTCPNVSGAYVSKLKITLTSASTPTGTIILMSGNDSAVSYDSTFTQGPTLVNNLVAAGFNVVQLRTGNWLQGSPTFPGLRVLACRAATSVDWIYKNVHVGGQSFPMCFSGNSGGSGVGGYVVSHYGLASGNNPEVSLMMPTGGPVFSRVDMGCGLVTAPNQTSCVGTTTPLYNAGQASAFIDPAFGTGTCTNKTGSPAVFQTGSVVSGSDEIITFPHANMLQLFGTLDNTVAPAQGILWFNSLGNTTKSTSCVSGADHQMANSVAGEAAIETNLKNNCKLY